MNVIAMIPARMGSERLKMKNLAMLNGRPLISYAIDAAKSSGVFSRVVVNSDGDIFQRIAQRYGVDFYHRAAGLGSSDTRSDEVVYDFMLKYSCDAVAWVNPISPLQTAEEIRKVVEHFIEKRLDSLITVEDQPVPLCFRREAHQLQSGRFVRQDPGPGACTSLRIQRHDVAYPDLRTDFRETRLCAPVR